MIWCRQHDRLQVVGTNGQDFQVGKNFLEKSSRFTQLLLRDINRDINGRVHERFDQNTSLCAGAGAESDELDIRSELRCDLGAISIQNVDLGSGDVIFLQLANFLEQHRSPFIVKIFAWKRTRIARETGDYI